jgi:uncharacterized protein
MTEPPPTLNSVMAAMLRGLTQLPDLRAALEGLSLFLLVVAAGVGAVLCGVLTLHPIASRNEMLTLSLAAFIVPSLMEELVFRGWLEKGAPIAAVVSLVAFIFWHPLQVMIGSPFARPEFMDPRFLLVVGVLGLACSLSRIRSGSIWPNVVIHWGIAVVWKALFAG